MKNVMRSMLETQWTPDQALVWAKKCWIDQARWPSRRFRVEGGRAGNSRLLGKSAAENACALYGGIVVELIPGRRAYLLDRDGIKMEVYESAK